MKPIFCFLLMIFSGSFSAQTVRQADAKEFSELVKRGKGTVIDLRTDGEINSKGQIPGSVQMDFLSKDFEARLDSLDRNRQYLIYCAGGGRSADCAAQMRDKGFNNVIELKGGFDSWKRQGFPVSKPARNGS